MYARIRFLLLPVLLAAAVVSGAVLLTRDGGQEAALAVDAATQGNSEPGIAPRSPTTATFVYVCYQVELGRDELVAVRLTTENFGGDLVGVRQLVVMCEGAFKTAPGTTVTPPLGPVFACYELERGQDPADPYLLDTVNFEQDRVNVRNSRMMCESAGKAIPDRPDHPAVPLLDPPEIWQCFEARLGDVHEQDFEFVTHNFGSDRATVRVLLQLCETARKERQVTDAAGNVTVVVSGEATGQVMACYELVEGDDPNVVANLRTKNFRFDRVVVRTAIMMCEPAEKKPILTIPGFPN